MRRDGGRDGKSGCVDPDRGYSGRLAGRLPGVATVTRPKEAAPWSAANEPEASTLTLVESGVNRPTIRIDGLTVGGTA